MLKLRENGFVEYAKENKAVLKLKNTGLFAVVTREREGIVLNHVRFTKECLGVIKDCPPYALDANIEEVVSTRLFDSIKDIEHYFVISDMYCSQF